MTTETNSKTSSPTGFDGTKAVGVYLQLVVGLEAQVRDLRKDKRLWQAVGVVSVAGLVMLLPLKSSIPYFYEVNSDTGRVGISTRVAEELKVSDKNTAYFLRLWVARLITINAATLKEGLPSAYKWTRGAAQTELDEWVGKEDKTTERIVKTPGLTRDLLGIPNVSFNEERSVAFIDVTYAERINGVETERRRKLLTLEFGMAAPKAGRRTAADVADDSDNPLSIAITHFTISEQMSTSK